MTKNTHFMKFGNFKTKVVIIRNIYFTYFTIFRNVCSSQQNSTLVQKVTIVFPKFAIL